MQVFNGGDAQSTTKPSEHIRALMDDLKLTLDDIGASSIFRGDEELFAFARVLSRLSEMRTQHYHQLATRT